MKTDNPICGACGKPLHQHSNSIAFCHQTDTAKQLGCVFTDVPSAETLVAFMERKLPTSMRIATAAWRSEAGHE